jgi:hypothetical protein
MPGTKLVAQETDRHGNEDIGQDRQGVTQNAQVAERKFLLEKKD